jgi:ABC-type nickel/cobalt efflux system permease component RcnA
MSPSSIGTRTRAPSAARLLAACAIFILLLQPQADARAHPADMYAQNFAVGLRADGLRLDWQILPGPFLADAVWAAADLDRSGEISDAEAVAWIAPFISSLSVDLGGQRLVHSGAQGLHWPSTVDVMRTAEDRIRFSLRFEWASGVDRTRTLEIHAAHLEPNSLNWFAVSADAPLFFAQPEQDNGLVRAEVHFDDQGAAADRLTTWNSGTPNLTGFSAAVSQLAADLTDAGPSAEPAAAPGSSVTEALTGLVKTQEFTHLFLGGAFLLSLVLGSLHALTPGHGKALVGAYLVGSQGRTRDAVFLGAIVTLTHTGSVVLLGIVTLFASHYILPALIAPWLEIISGVLVIGFGLSLLFRRGGELSNWLSGRRPAHHHDEDDRDHGHSHPHPHPHPHEHPEAAPQVTLRSLLALGISGGLVPCPDAIAILLVAVAVNRIPFGMLLILSFSIGLALVLIGIGIAMVKGVKLVARSEAISRFAVYAPVISAVVVTGLGAALTVSALGSLRFGTQVVQSAAQAGAAAVYDASQARLLYIAPDSTRRDQLFILPLASGEPAQFTREPTGITGYSVSPDGGIILYTLFKSDGGTAIQAIDSDGSSPRRVLDCPSSECNSPRWYPDGQRLAYERLDESGESVVPRFSLWWLDLSTGGTRPVFQDDAFASYSPQFSPDGAWLSYVSGADNTLVLFNLTDGRSHSLPLGPQAALPAAWSPRSDAVLFGSQLGPGQPLNARIFNLSTEAITELGGPEGSTDYSATWSPDGAWIAIDRNVPLGNAVNSNQVWLVRPDGTGAHVLLQEEGASYSSLTWAPDARHLLYARYVLDLTSTTPGRFDIYMADVETGASELLVEGGDMPALLP